jgi:hypothetical protein
MKNYTIEQLKKIRDIKAKGFDDYLDDVYTSDKQMFNKQTDLFFDCITETGESEKIDDLIKPTWITQQRIVDILSVDDNLRNRISIRDKYYVSIKFDAFSIEVRIMENYVDIWVQEKTAYVVTSVPIPSTLSSYFSNHLRFTVNCVINHRAI